MKSIRRWRVFKGAVNARTLLHANSGPVSGIAKFEAKIGFFEAQSAA
jgi:hypothetical protein